MNIPTQKKKHNYTALSLYFYLIILCLLNFNTAVYALQVDSSTPIAHNEHTSWADVGEIEGTVLTIDGQPAAKITIRIDGKAAAQTDEKGRFSLASIPEGLHTVTASMVGVRPVSQQVNVSSTGTTYLTLTLNADAQQLQEVTINAQGTNKFAQKETAYVARMPLKNLENPQVYNSIPSVLLKEQVIIRLDDALKNAPGITQLWESTGRGGDGAGYFSLRGFAVQPTMINGLPSLTNGSPDPANIERIEVIKGPSGTLFGSSLISYGGLINIITKKPYHGFGAEVSYVAGSYGLNRVTADVNAALSTIKDIALRINTAWHSESSFQDAGFRKSLFIAPTLSYQVNERLSFLMSAEFYQGERTNPLMIFFNRSRPLAAENMQELGYDHKASFTNNDLSFKNPTFNLQGQMNYQLADGWVSQTVLSRSSSKSDGYYSYIWDLADGEGTYQRYFSMQNADLLGTDIQQNFIGDFKIGNLRNRLVAGVDYFHRSYVNNSSGYVIADSIIISEPGTGSISKSRVDAALAGTTANKSKTEEEVLSAYFSDVLNITPSLLVMASLRLDYFNNQGNVATDEDDFDQVALSPKFGVVYQPVQDKLALFANYMNGFSNVGPQEETIDGVSIPRTFRPEHANQWETGVKLTLLDEKIAATVSYYDIRVSDVVRQEVIENSDPEPDIIYIQDGENYSKGIETAFTLNPAPGLNLIMGYSYNDSKVVKTNDENIVGRRPEAAGPEHLANAWISYRVNEGQLSGLGFGFGGNYVSENKIMNRSNTGVFALPAYTVMNASASYGTGSYELSLKLDNLTNKEYYNGWSTANPQMPRRLLASVTFRF
ncbi:TonB-dependent receptor [Parapedobacter tibetensis]|uniref:TonB-dependent receptor n=1 Tax=Parapedobacter tibetensis TaxID=2972951 RepID=UPI00214DCC07|nr:TonB-dependent receptor [Parapedobacter tibetensis]